MNEGFIKIYRQLLEWEWYTDTNTKVLFLHCLLKANFKTKKYQKNTVKKGSFVTSLESLSKETGLTIQQTRTALSHLISTGELTSKSSNKNRIITVVNYDKFQEDNKQNNKQLTSKQQTKQQVSNKQSTSNQQATNKQLTTVEERKNVVLSPTGIILQEEGKKSASPGVAESSTGLPSVKEMRTFAEEIPGSDDSMACRFLYAFEVSGTRMPKSWKELYRRFVGLDYQQSHDFLDKVTAGEFRKKWGSL